MDTPSLEMFEAAVNDNGFDQVTLMAWADALEECGDPATAKGLRWLAERRNAPERAGGQPGNGASGALVPRSSWSWSTSPSGRHVIEGLVARNADKSLKAWILPHMTAAAAFLAAAKEVAEQFLSSDNNKDEFAHAAIVHSMGAGPRSEPFFRKVADGKLSEDAKQLFAKFTSKDADIAPHQIFGRSEIDPNKRKRDVPITLKETPKE